MINKVFLLLTKSELLNQTLKTVGIKGLSIVSSFGASIIIARSIGVADFGELNYILRLVTITAAFSLFGTEIHFLRTLARTGVNGASWKGTVSDYLSFGLISIIFFSLAILFFRDTRFFYLIIALPFIAFNTIFSTILKSTSRTWIGVLFKEELPNISRCIILLGLYFLAEISVTQVAFVYMLSFVITTTGAFLFLWNKKLIYFRIPKLYHLKKYLMICAPLFLISFFEMISINFVLLLLGFMDETYNAGLYTIALSIIVIPNIMLFSFNTAISPKLSLLIKKRKNLEIQENLNAICGIQTLIGMGIFFVVLLFGKQILAAWGKDFVEAYDLIIVLFTGVLFNLSTGGTGILLTLSGRYKLVSQITFLSTVLNVVLPYFVYLKFDLIGLGYLFALNTVFANVIRLILVKKYFGFYIYPGFSKKVMKSLIKR